MQAHAVSMNPLPSTASDDHDCARPCMMQASHRLSLHRRKGRTLRGFFVLMAAAALAGCATVTPGPFQITVRDTDDTVLEQFQFQAGSYNSLEIAIIGMCRVYPDATVTADQLQTHERVQERCKRSFASMLTLS